MVTTTAQRVALITGGNRGLGRASALALAADGADIILTYRSNADEAAGVVDDITALGRTAVALQLDTTAFSSFDAFVGELRSTLADRFDRANIDILMNNAGSVAVTPLGGTTEQAVDTMIDVHFKGVVLLTQALAPLIADGGRILNVSTGLSRFYGEGFSVYASMKGAIEVYTKYLARELGSRRIAVNAIAPGATATDFGGGTVRDNVELRATIGSVTAMGRVGEPADIAGAVVSILSESAGWITAQRIEASGGQLL
jgi:NAD(P)-dependent dehydrogenase (short-subunit alcohol dehydrogenase family)